MMTCYEVFMYNPPDIYRELYNILDDAKQKADFPFANHSLAFRCHNCEDVVEIRIKDIKEISFFNGYLRVDFDDTSIWLVSYDKIEDIWIEKFQYLEDEQRTLFEV